MKSINFEFLGDGWSDLAALGGFAEAYAILTRRARWSS